MQFYLKLLIIFSVWSPALGPKGIICNWIRRFSGCILRKDFSPDVSGHGPKSVLNQLIEMLMFSEMQCVWFISPVRFSSQVF